LASPVDQYAFTLLRRWWGSAYWGCFSSLEWSPAL